jgi:hypothetical protein
MRIYFFMKTLMSDSLSEAVVVDCGKGLCGRLSSLAALGMTMRVTNKNCHPERSEGT